MSSKEIGIQPDLENSGLENLLGHSPCNILLGIIFKGCNRIFQVRCLRTIGSKKGSTVVLCKRHTTEGPDA